MFANFSICHQEILVTENKFEFAARSPGKHHEAQKSKLSKIFHKFSKPPSQANNLAALILASWNFTEKKFTEQKSVGLIGHVFASRNKFVFNA